MATPKEIASEVAIALKEIGRITPHFDKEVGEWVFAHPKYPVECGGETKNDVMKNYPLYLKEFIKERMKNNLNVATEMKTTGRGGARPGAGRPKGTKKKKEQKRMYVPYDLVNWLKDEKNIVAVRKLKASLENAFRLK
jgi:hypothetical protein